MTDPSLSPTPRRLLFQDGTWTLELEHLFAIDPHILRPSTHEIRGVESILAWIRGSAEHRGLMGQTKELVESAPAPAAETVFELRADRWVRTSRPRKATVASEQLARAQQEALARIAQLEAEVSYLSAQLSSAESKIEALSARLASLASGVPVAPQAPRIARASRPPAPPTSVSLSPRAPAPAPQESHRLLLPSAHAVDQALKLLVGEKTSLAEVPHKKHASILDEAAWYSLSLLQDDAGETVGCVLADLQGAVRLGGGMMMLPPAFMQEQIRTRAPSPEVDEAISEVFNNICALLNAIKSNPHVRSSPAQRVADASGVPAWLPSSSNRLLLSISDGGWLLVAGRS